MAPDTKAQARGCSKDLHFDVSKKRTNHSAKYFEYLTKVLPRDPEFFRTQVAVKVDKSKEGRIYYRIGNINNFSEDDKDLAVDILARAGLVDKTENVWAHGRNKLLCLLNRDDSQHFIIAPKNPDCEPPVVKGFDEDDPSEVQLKDSAESNAPSQLNGL